MKVAVLTAGRAGSMSLYQACRHIRNFSAGHDSKEGELAAQRAQIADGHIEIDTRFAWMLGQLEERNPQGLHYVFLTRDTAGIAASYNRRWTNRKGVMRGYCETILQRDKPVEDMAVARDMVETVEANIRSFLSGKPHSVIRLENWEKDLPKFFTDIGAEADTDAAFAAFAERHNASKRTSLLVRTRFALSRQIDAAERFLKRSRS
ncbi:MAG: hypothetical protein ABJP34_02890 [Erythrobacter sp.]